MYLLRRKKAEENFQEEKSESYSYTVSKSAHKAFENQMEKKIVVSMKKYLHRILCIRIMNNKPKEKKTVWSEQKKSFCFGKYHILC